MQSEGNQRNVQIGLVADVSNAWLTLAADMARLQLAQDTLASREKAYALTKRMFEIGSTSGLVLAQNLSTVETARVDVAAYTSQVGARPQRAALAGGWRCACRVAAQCADPGRERCQQLGAVARAASLAFQRIAATPRCAGGRNTICVP